MDIEPRFPSYIAVPDKQVDAFASGVDTIYRKEQFNLLSVHRPEALTLLDRTTASLDRRSQLALGIACMKIYGGINLEDGIEKANDFIHQVSRKWDMVWPAPDSLGTEFVAMLGKGLGASGQQEGSIAAYKDAILRSQAAHHWERAGAYGRALAYAYLRNGQRDSARTVFARLTEWYAAPSTRDTTWWAGTLLASITSDPDSLLSRLGQVSRLLPGIHNPQVISFYYGVRGRHLAESGRTTAGATCFQQAVLAIDTITEKTIPQAEAHAIDLHNTAYAFRNLGDSTRSRLYGTKAVALNEALMRSDDPMVARSARSRLAGTLEVMPLSDSCDAKYGTGPAKQMSVLRLRSMLLPIDSPLLAKTYANIASEYYHWGAAGIDSVLKYADLCLAWPSRGETIAALQMKAYAQAKKGLYAASLETARAACARLCGNDRFSWDSLDNAAFPTTLWTIIGLGNLQEVLEELQIQVPAIRSARLLERLSTKQLVLIDSLFLVEGTDLNSLVRARELMTARLIRNAWPKPGEQTETALTDSLFAWMDDDKAMMFRRDRYLMGQADLMELHSMTNVAKELRESLIQNGLPELHPDVLRCSTRIDSLEAILARPSAHTDAPTHVDMGLAHQLRKHLQAGVAVISYRLTKSDVFLMCLDRDTLLLNRFSRDPVFDGMMKALTDGRSGIDSLSIMAPSKRDLLCRLLPTDFIRPGIKEILLLPSRELCYVPLESLPLGPQGSTLLDHCSVRYALSASALLEVPVDPEPLNELQMIAFAPQYGLGITSTSNDAVTRNILMAVEERSRSGPLLHNQDEVVAIARQVTATSYVAEKADESAFKASLAGGSVLHMAMHAYSDAEPSRSGLVFNIMDQIGDGTRAAMLPVGEDGVFHAYELLTRRVNSPLVVLSACETGQGEYQNGEGIRSLARSFMLAGARSTVASLWKVDDQATKEIMVKFYEKLAEGMGKADALVEAKRWYRRTYPNEPPSKWAAFILIGDNEPVLLKKRSPMRPWMWGAGVVLLIAGAAFLRQRSTRQAA